MNPVLDTACLNLVLIVFTFNTCLAKRIRFVPLKIAVRLFFSPFTSAWSSEGLETRFAKAYCFFFLSFNRMSVRHRDRQVGGGGGLNYN